MPKEASKGKKKRSVFTSIKTRISKELTAKKRALERELKGTYRDLKSLNPRRIEKRLKPIFEKAKTAALIAGALV